MNKQFQLKEADLFSVFSLNCPPCNLLSNRIHPQAARITSQLKLVIRPMYSNPPIYGARLVSEILSNPVLAHEWSLECKVRCIPHKLSRDEARGKLLAHDVPRDCRSKLIKIFRDLDRARWQ